jgi:hypothetical protein
VGPKTTVVSDPYFLMPSQALSGQEILLKAKSSSLINNTTMSHMRLTTPESSTTELIGLDGSASVTFTATGSIGTEVLLKAQAFDALGNSSNEITYVVTISTSFVNKALVISPLNEASNVYNGLVIETNPFSTTGATDTLNRTEFEIRTAPLGGGSLIWANSIELLLSIQVPDYAVPEGSTVYIRARHVGNTLGVGQWSDDTQVSMASVLPPSQYGDPYQGGFYAGQIKVGTNWYAVVVSPLSQQTLLQSATSTLLGLTTQAKSLDDGWSNTNELVSYVPNDSFPAASYCYNLLYNGYSDWYLPSIMELELAYRTLKPTTAPNILVQSPVSDITGTNATPLYTENATLWPSTTLPEKLTNYSNVGAVAFAPSVTSSVVFQGSEVIEGFREQNYWSSSGPSSLIENRENMVSFNFSGGSVYQNAGATGIASSTTAVNVVRPFRRVYLRSEA